MTNSKPVKMKPRGKPFKKGDDPRRNTAGNLNAEAQSWGIEYRNWLAKKLTPEKAAEVTVDAYKRKQAWAVQEVNERLGGKVSQPIETDQNILYRIIYEKPKPTEDEA